MPTNATVRLERNSPPHLTVWPWLLCMVRLRCSTYGLCGFGLELKLIIVP